MSSIGIASSTDISIDMSAAIDPATVGPQSFRVFGRWSGPAAGTLFIEDGDTRIRFDPDHEFFAGESVTVSLSDSIRFTDGTSLESGFAWSFWIESMPALLEVREIARVPIRRAGESHIQSYGAYAGDLNDDGWSDLVIPNEQTGDVRVFLNESGLYSSFDVIPIPFSSVPSTNEGADFNRDGFLDVAVGSGANENVHVAFGDGSGNLSMASPLPTEGNVRGLCVLDVDADGDEDIVTASRINSSLYLLINNGDGSFRSRIAIDGHGDSETACAVGDANGDGVMDLFVGSLASSHVALLLGNGRGGLQMSNRVVVDGRPWMLASGDLNLDGFADVVVAGSDGNSVSVVLSDGSGLLRPPVSYPSGRFPLAIDLGDLDGDGDLDMISSNYGSADFTVYENLGDGSYRKDRAYRADRAGSCAILHDRDNDGDLDITGIDELEDLLILFETDAVSTGVDDLLDHVHPIAMRAWPNPFTTEVVVSVDAPTVEPIRFTIYDMLGRVVASSRDHDEHVFRWTPERMPIGPYVATARLGRHSVSTVLMLLR